MAFNFKLLNLPPPKVPALSIGVTGHRPDKLGGYDFGNPVRKRLREELRKTTEKLVRSAKRDTMDAGYRDAFLSRVHWQRGLDIGEKWRDFDVLCLQGGAQGADQDAAAVWYQMGLPYVVVVPFPKQDRVWPEMAQMRFRKMLELAAGIYLVSEETPANQPEAAKMLLRRNEVLCQMSDELIAVWDGSRGGTSHCVNWWNSVHFHDRFTRLDPREF